MPITFELGNVYEQGYESELTVKNKGRYDGSGYDVPEFIKVYGIRAKIVASDGSSCQLHLPLTAVVAD